MRFFNTPIGFQHAGFGPRCGMVWLGCWLLATQGVATGTLEAAETVPPTAEQIDFFESKIRPVLVARCLGCHGQEAGQPDGGLMLDRAAGWRIGGDSGPAIVPGDSATSLVMSAIRYESLEMPPDGKLPDEVIADFEKWIADGAADPRDNAMAEGLRHGEIDWDQARRFWAFLPPRVTSPAAVRDASWSRDAIDAYVLARLEAEGLTPAPDAEPLVRLRRLAFDLTGLPPSPQLIEAFRDEPSEANWARLVDTLLHSPAYAEHWARHWLDVARYADSNGSDFNATFHDAWRYRELVIRGFAEDKPFDRFVVQQIAGDLLATEDPAEVADNLVATGFLMLGTKMLSERDKAKLEMDVVDDMIDTVGRAFLGLTLGCARCHDHKFDPIPTKDYYALAGIFRSTQVLDGESQKYVSTWHKRPLPVAEVQSRAFVAYQAEADRLNAEFTAAKKRLEAVEKAKPSSAAGLVIDDSQAVFQGDWQRTTYTKPYHGEGYAHDNNRDQGQSQVTFPGPSTPGRYEVRIAYTPGANRASNVPVTLMLGTHSNNSKTPASAATADPQDVGIRRLVLNQRLAPAIAPYWHSLGEFEYGAVAPASLVIRNDGTDGYVLADAVQYLRIGDAQANELAEDDPAVVAWKATVEQAKLAHQQAQAAYDALQAGKPEPLPMAMAVREAAKVGNTFVCIRGEVDNPGPEVPRGFLRIGSSGEPVEIPPDQSGRLQLAHWVTDPDNPLTARVIVNRVWMHLFGEGLVRTVDNFGVQGDRPSHPELLDHLAIEFVRDGWSIRRLVRRLVMTRAYRQSSRYDTDAFERDPDNRWLWRASRRRLPAEAMRDTLLVATGRFDPTASVAPMAAFGVLVSQNVATPTEVKVESTPRRSIYLPVIRGELPSLLVTFDFADPDLIVGRRESTNVPAQGLTMLNNVQVSEWCQEIAARLLREHADDESRLRLAYHLLLQADPPDDQRRWVLDFIASNPDPAAGWAKAVQTLAASTAFRFLD